MLDQVDLQGATRVGEPGSAKGECGPFYTCHAHDRLVKSRARFRIARRNCDVMQRIGGYRIGHRSPVLPNPPRTPATNCHHRRHYNGLLAPRTQSGRPVGHTTALIASRSETLTKNGSLSIMPIFSIFMILGPIFEIRVG